MVLQATELHWLSIAGAAKAFRAREVSPVELTRHLLERAERYQDSLFTFVTLTPEIALEQARTAEAAFLRGDATSPLLGIPMGYKDIYFTKGVRTTAGSQLHKDFVPDFDATTVRKLNEAGAVMLGKLTTWEFAGGGNDLLHSYFPSARNPWNAGHTPAGSSSGSGTALAAGIVAGALGTDTGGSIRGPAAACGIAGLKPTYGRCSDYGVFPASWSLDHTGPMARTVEDCALMLNVLAGYDPLDTGSADVPVQDYTLTLGKPVTGLRLGVPQSSYFSQADPEVMAAFEASIEVLRGLGAVPVEIDMPQPAPGVSIEGHAYHRTDLIENPKMIGENLAARHSGGGAYFASEYIQSQRMRAMLKEQLRQLLLSVDVILMPGAAKPAPTMEDAVALRMGAANNPSYTRIWNQVGLPALAIPNGFSANGMPLSLQIAGRPFDEATVLQVGHAFEQATEWHLRRPTL